MHRFVTVPLSIVAALAVVSPALGHGPGCIPIASVPYTISATGCYFVTANLGNAATAAPRFFHRATTSIEGITGANTDITDNDPSLEYTARKGTANTMAQNAEILGKCLCQKWGANSGNRAIERSMPTKGITLQRGSFAPSPGPWPWPVSP